MIYCENQPVYSVKPDLFSQHNIRALLKSRLCVIVANEYNVGSNNGRVPEKRLEIHAGSRTLHTGNVISRNGLSGKYLPLNSR